jgi:hypothetical protein
MTYSFPFRLMILQSALRFLMDAFTFITFSFVRRLFRRRFLLVSEYDSSLRQIVRRHFQPHAVSRKDTDVIHPHLSGNVSQDLMAVFQLHPEHRVRKCFGDRPVLFY